ncbi:MAG TPA: DNA polymerase IV [Aestuariivirgaceae bacterium]|jgi:DNA polymerase-4
MEHGALPRHPNGFCRDCLTTAGEKESRCARCHSPRLLRHPELHQLSIAHIDCDAFYAAVEKRDNPELRDKPVIVGGGKRGVVATACYVARIPGVRSAMPMFKALELCPEAVVVSPRMERYAEVGRQVRRFMLEFTPLVEPLSIDEAFLDLSGTERLHEASPACSLARLANRVEAETGISVSIGLSYNKYLAKVASDLDKPRGFSVIGRADAKGFLSDRPVSLIWGVGKMMQAELARQGITTIGQLQTMERRELIQRFGALGHRLYHLSRGEDEREVSLSDEAKSIGAETTFSEDISEPAELERILWQMTEKVSRRTKRADLAGSTIVLKLKTRDFRLRTRSQTIADPTQLAERIFATARILLRREADGTAFRLIGVSLSNLSTAGADKELEDLELSMRFKARAERAMDRLRDKFGPAAVEKGLVFKRDASVENPPGNPPDWMDD